MWYVNGFYSDDSKTKHEFCAVFFFSLENLICFLFRTNKICIFDGEVEFRSFAYGLIFFSGEINNTQ